MAEVGLFGGSTVLGIGDFPAGGFAGRIKTELLQPLPDGTPSPHHVIISAKCQRDILTVTEMLPANLNRLAAGPKLGIFMVGASESRIQPGQIEPVVPLPEFSQALKSLTGLCMELQVTPVFIGFHAIRDHYTQPFPVTGDYFNDERLVQYTQTVAEHAESIDARFIPTRAALGGLGKRFDSYIYKDNLHLNTAGHIALLDIVHPGIMSEIAAIDAINTASYN